MNEAIELHDSTLAAVRRDGAAISVLLEPAYVHRSEARPAFGAGSGWLQPSELRFAEATVEGEPPHSACWISDGSLDLDGERFENLVPTPLEHSGRVVLTLLTDVGERVVIAGRGLLIVPLGEARYLEECP